MACAKEPLHPSVVSAKVTPRAAENKHRYASVAARDLHSLKVHTAGGGTDAADDVVDPPRCTAGRRKSLGETE
jgi:hypothetical protein